MGIVDFHTHLFDVCNVLTSPNIAGKKTGCPPTNLYDLLGRPLVFEWLVKYKLIPQSLVTRSAQKSAEFANITNLRSSMESSGISQSLILPIEPYVNTFHILEHCINYTNVRPLMSIDLQSLEPSQINITIKNYLTKFKFKGFKFHPNLQNIDPLSNKAYELYSVLDKFKLFILIHAGVSPTLSDTRRHISTLRKMSIITKDFPNLKFIVSHIGHFFDPHHDNLVFKLNPHNVWLDTSGVGHSIIIEALKSYPHENLLFGSDWPYFSQSTSINILKKGIHKYLKRNNKKDIDLIFNKISSDNAKSFLS